MRIGIVFAVGRVSDASARDSVTRCIGWSGKQLTTFYGNCGAVLMIIDFQNGGGLSCVAFCWL